MTGVEVNDTQLRVIQAGLCGTPVMDTPWPTYCVRTAGHRHPCMAVSDTCAWCDELVRPDGREWKQAVRPESAWLHLGCLMAMDAERIGTRFNEVAA